MANPSGLRTVRNILQNPGSGRPVARRTVTIRLNIPAGFIDGGSVEKIRTAYATTDDTGLWTAQLEVNSDITPPGTYYTVAEAPGLIWTFVVPAGDPNIPVDLFDCLVTNPVNPNPVILNQGGTAVVFQQSTPTTSVTVPHSLGRFPAVSVYIAGELVDAGVTVDNSNAYITFPSPQTFTVVLT
jgi:hypothetical protein